MSRIEDRQAISDLLVRYCTAIDTRDWDLFASVFTPDVDADYATIGAWQDRDAIVASMEEWHRDLGPSMHSLSNVAVDFEATPPDQPDRAHVSAHVNVLLMQADGRRGTTARGVYADEVVRGDGGWKICRRRFTMLLLGQVDNLG